MLAGVDREGDAPQDVQQPVVGQPDRPRDVGELEQAHPPHTVGSYCSGRAVDGLAGAAGHRDELQDGVAGGQSLGDLHDLAVGQAEADRRAPRASPSAATTQTLPFCTVPCTDVTGTTTTSAAVPLVISTSRPGRRTR